MWNCQNLSNARTTRPWIEQWCFCFHMHIAVTKQWEFLQAAGRAQAIIMAFYAALLSPPGSNCIDCCIICSFCSLCLHMYTNEMRCGSSMVISLDCCQFLFISACAYQLIAHSLSLTMYHPVLCVKALILCIFCIVITHFYTLLFKGYISNNNLHKYMRLTINKINVNDVLFLIACWSGWGGRSSRYGD